MNEKNTANFMPYEGDEPYIFVSYSHEDSFRVIPLLNALNKANYRVWYDKGIYGGSNWCESVGQHILNCSVCIPLLSSHSLQSEICIAEITYAQSESKTRQIFPIRLEKIKLPPGLFQLHSLHYLRLYDYADIQSFVNSLEQEPILQPCRKSKADILPTPDERVFKSLFEDCDNLYALLQRAIITFRDITQSDYNQIILFTKIDRHTSGLVVYADDIPDGKQCYRLVVQNGLIYKAYVEQNYIIQNYKYSDPDYFVAVPQTESELVIPIKNGMRVIGVLNSESDSQNAYGNIIVKKSISLANSLGQALINAGFSQSKLPTDIPYIHLS